MLFSMSFQPYQGRYLRVYNQARALVEAGYDVTLLAWDRECQSPEEETRDGIKIKRFHIRAGVGRGPHRNALNVVRFNLTALRFLMSTPVDIIHSYNLDAIVFSLLAAKLRRKKAVLDLCEPEYYAFWGKPFKWLLKLINMIETGLARRYDHLFVHNQYQVKKFRNKGITHLTHAGSYPNQSMLRSRTVRPGSNNRVIIGRIGTIYENNGIEELVEAFKRLVQRQESRENRLSYGLLLAGRVYDSFKPSLEELLEPIRDHVELYGSFHAKDLGGLYGKIDISVIVTRKTQWFRNITPTKLFDSLVNGVPVIANDIGEVSEILQEGSCGIIVDESDPESICDGIEQLSLNRELRSRMANNALNLAREKYTWEVYKEDFLSAYNSLLTGNSQEE